MTKLLKDVGFVDIQKLSISNIEKNEGFDDAMLRPGSINIKCRKPQSSQAQAKLRIPGDSGT